MMDLLLDCVDCEVEVSALTSSGMDDGCDSNTSIPNVRNGRNTSLPGIFYTAL
jgi:hypothetical protein